MRIYYLLVCLLQGSESSDTETEHLLSPVRVRRPPAMSFLARWVRVTVTPLSVLSLPPVLCGVVPAEQVL